MKKTQQVKVVSKTSVAPVVEGTSVMPRQRPKGSSTTPLNLNNIPLTISPSPTLVKKSQSPIVPTTQQNFPGNIAYGSGFSNTPNPTPTFSPDFHTKTDFFPTDLTQPRLDSLFQSSIYPDPFRDDKNDASPTVADMCNGNKADLPNTQPNIATPVSPDNPLFGSDAMNQSMTMKSGMTESRCMVETKTPPPSPSLALPKGHRRNMSDTTAFNK